MEVHSDLIRTKLFTSVSAWLTSWGVICPDVPSCKFLVLGSENISPVILQNGLNSFTAFTITRNKCALKYCQAQRLVSTEGSIIICQIRRQKEVGGANEHRTLRDWKFAHNTRCNYYLANLAWSILPIEVVMQTSLKLSGFSLRGPMCTAWRAVCAFESISWSKAPEASSSYVDSQASGDFLSICCPPAS